MTEHPKYHIKTPADFLKIPLEKVQHALTDFANWIAFVHAIQDVVKENSERLKGLELDLSEFIWVDDGLHEIIPTFTRKETEEKDRQP